MEPKPTFIEALIPLVLFLLAVSTPALLLFTLMFFSSRRGQRNAIWLRFKHEMDYLDTSHASLMGYERQKAAEAKQTINGIFNGLDHTVSRMRR